VLDSVHYDQVEQAVDRIDLVQIEEVDKSRQVLKLLVAHPVDDDDVN
jgi:hypothetical protein